MRCQNEKPLTEFRQDCRRPGWRAATCNACISQRAFEARVDAERPLTDRELCGIFGVPFMPDVISLNAFNERQQRVARAVATVQDRKLSRALGVRLGSRETVESLVFVFNQLAA